MFTPGAFPKHTYVERESATEKQLRDALDTPRQIVSLSGPSKSGKTVLVERVVGLDSLIPVGGARIVSADDVWQRALDWMKASFESTVTRSVGNTASIQAGGKAEVNALVAKGEVNASIGASVTGQQAITEKTERSGMHQVAREIANSEYAVLLDDFHYMPRDVQNEVAKQIKEAVRLGIKIITAAVPHRADDVVRANPELRGRVMSIDLGYWRREDLIQIAELGFRALSVTIAPKTLSRFAIESAGSPQLMQALCLQTCFLIGVREVLEAMTPHNLTREQEQQILERTAATTDFRSLVDVLDAGPRKRGTERKIYDFKDGTNGDVYRCVLKSIAREPLRLSFDYEEITQRVRAVCKGEFPVGSSVTGTCDHMSRLAAEHFTRERVIDWDETKSVLDVPDPYLMFFLRWSGRLLEE